MPDNPTCLRHENEDPALFFALTPDLKPWLMENDFTPTCQSFVDRWNSIKTQYSVNETAPSSEKKKPHPFKTIAEKRYLFYRETLNMIQDALGKRGTTGKLAPLEASGVPCSQIREAFKALWRFLKEDFVEQMDFWYAEQWGEIEAFQKALSAETDPVKKKYIRDSFFDAHFELKTFNLSIANQPRNSNLDEKKLHQKIDTFISRDIGLPQGDLSLEMAEMGMVETDYICLRKNKAIAGIFTGWPQGDRKTGETIYYSYLCASHPELPGLGLGTRLYENFFDDNHLKQAAGKPYYKTFIGAVNPFGQESYLHIHRLGAVCGRMIERNRYITDKFEYYGGITPHRMILEFSSKGFQTARKRFIRAAGGDETYTPKQYPPPPKENRLSPCQEISLFPGIETILKNGESIILEVSLIKEKFDHTEMNRARKRSVEKESCIFYDNCLFLFEKGYHIVDCLLPGPGKKVRHGYIFSKNVDTH